MKRGVNYINDDDLVYEIILSQGKGFLTNRAIEMIYLIAINIIRRKQYYNKIDAEDCMQSGIEIALKNWHNFNYKKYNKALPYFTEVVKRGMALAFNQLHDTRMSNNFDYVNDKYNGSI